MTSGASPLGSSSSTSAPPAISALTRASSLSRTAFITAVMRLLDFASPVPWLRYDPDQPGGIIMRPAFWTALLFSTITAGLAAQSTSEKKPPPAPPRPLTLTGCVEKGSETPYQYTIADDLNGKYEVSGSDI